MKVHKVLLMAEEAEQVMIAEKFSTSSQFHHIFIFIPITRNLWFQIIDTYYSAFF